MHDRAADAEAHIGVWGGVARVVVTAPLEHVRAAVGGVVEACPEQTEDSPPRRGAYLHPGREELYAGLGFVRDRRIATWRWMVRAEIQPDPAPTRR